MSTSYPPAPNCILFEEALFSLLSEDFLCPQRGSSLFFIVHGLICGGHKKIYPFWGVNKVRNPPSVGTDL
jgi:hypothetical protein